MLIFFIESVLKVFKYFNLLRVWSLGVSFWCFHISLIVKLSNFRVNRHVKVLIKIFIHSEKYLKSNSRGLPFSYNRVPSAWKYFRSLCWGWPKSKNLLSKSSKYWNLQNFVTEIFKVTIGFSPELMNNIFEFIKKPNFLWINSQFRPEDPNDKTKIMGVKVKIRI